MKSPSVSPLPMAKYLVLAAGIVLSLVCGALYAWSVFVLPIEARFGWTRSATGVTFTCAMICFSLGMAVGGLLIKRIGPRLTTLCGAVLLSGGFWGASHAQSLYMLYLSYGVLAGFGIGITNIVPSMTCPRWYPQRSGLIYGILAFSLATGSFVFGTLIASPLIQSVGIASTLQGLAALFILLLGISCFFTGYSPPAAALVSTSVKAEKGLGPWAMVQSPVFQRLWLWAFCLQIGGLMLAGHVVPLANSSGMSAAQAALLLGVFALSNGLGRVLLGYILDSHGIRMSLLLATGGMGMGLTILACLPAGSFAFMAGATVLVGAAFGGTIPQMSALVARFFGPRHLGVNIGVSTSSLLVAALVGPSLGGLAISLWDSYTPALWAGTALSLASVGAAVAVYSYAQQSARE